MEFVDGMTEVPDDKLATIVTYLQMFERPEQRPVPAPDGVTLHHHETPDLDWYRTLFRAVGGDYLWESRLKMEDARLIAHLSSSNVSVWSVRKEGQDLGLLELEWKDSDCELSFFGLAQPLIGGGVGRWLMNHAIEFAFERPIQRFFVHTCTLDSAQALSFYIRSGFTPYRRAVEIMQDPRLGGYYTADAAPQIPYLVKG